MRGGVVGVHVRREDGGVGGFGYGRVGVVDGLLDWR